MKPTVGRIVHYVTWNGVVPAIVVKVYNDTDTRVNLHVFQAEGNQAADEYGLKTYVDKNFDDNHPAIGSWMWPPRDAG